MARCSVAAGHARSIIPVTDHAPEPNYSPNLDFKKLREGYYIVFERQLVRRPGGPQIGKSNTYS